MINGPFIQPSTVAQGPFKCPTDTVGTGVAFRNVAGNVNVSVQCHAVGFDAVEGGYVSTLSSPSLTVALGSTAANPAVPVGAACPAGNALTGIRYFKSVFNNSFKFAPLCTPFFGGGLVVVGPIVGLPGVDPGIPNEVSCPAGRMVTGIAWLRRQRLDARPALDSLQLIAALSHVNGAGRQRPAFFFSAP
jgi:hypothetical protein